MAEPLAPYVFDAPVQRLRANDRVLKSPEPRLYFETVLYVRASRVGGEPVPYGPVTVVTAPHPGSIAAEALERVEEEPIIVPWGTRVTIERVPDAGEAYHVSALEPLTDDSRFTLQVLTELEVRAEDYPYAFAGAAGPAAGAVISELLGASEGATVIEVAPREGDAIGVWWYVDGHRVETPAEHSAREAADLFADHTVRLRPAGSDAGETCPACRRIISWADHLPPARRGEPARCMVRQAS